MAEDVTRFDTLDALVEHEMARLQIPGVAVGILHDGQVETYGYGVISLASGYPTKPDTLFQIGSNTKVFTATLAMRLVEDGVLDLDAPLNRYLPDLRLADPSAPSRITVRQLVTHMSGLEGDRFEGYGLGDDALSSAIERASDWAQETEPGEIWSYCNSGFYIAGRIIETLAGTGFETAMKERVLAPLDMERSCFFARDAIVYSAAAGHNQEPGVDAPELALPYELPRNVNPAGGIIAPVADVLKFYAFHMGDGTAGGERLLSETSLRAMREPQVTVNSAVQWGIGWSLRRVDGTWLMGHGGGTNGHITQTVGVPDKQFALAVFTNSSRGGQLNRRVERWALHRYRGLDLPEPARVALPAGDTERLIGQYERPLVAITVTRAPGGVTLEALRRGGLSGKEEQRLPPIPLAHIGGWEFIGTEGEWEGMRAEFIPDDDGAPRYLRFGSRLHRRVGTSERSNVPTF